MSAMALMAPDKTVREDISGTYMQTFVYAIAIILMVSMVTILNQC